LITVEKDKGTLVKYTRYFFLTIGDLAPGEEVNITFTAKLNTAPAQNQTDTETVTLTFDEGQSKTASRSYTMLASTLPGSGQLPLNWRGEGVRPAGIISSLVLFVLGGLLLALVVWAKHPSQKAKLCMLVGGALLVLVGFVTAIPAFGFLGSQRQAQSLYLTPAYSNDIAEQGDNSPTGLPWRPASAFSTPDSVIPIVTLPDYPIPSPVITITPQPGEPEPDTSAITRIVIPALMLDTVVKYVPFDGFTWLIEGLRQEIAWMGNTSWPGLGSNTALTGHVTVAGLGDGPFRHLGELPTGELVLLYTEQNIYTYQVRESLVTDAGDLSVVSPTDDAQISLITCVDWDEENHLYLNRLVVVADLVRTEPIAIGMIP